MVGRLIWQKGVRELVEVASILRQRFPTVKFQLAGEWDPSHPDAVDRHFVESAVADGRIEFLGFRTDLESLLPTASVFVLPSRYREGTPRSLLEAAACGVPVVAFDVPGSREAIVDGETGFLLPSRDVVGLARAVGQLLSDDGLRARMGRAARAFVEDRFDATRITAATLNVYRELATNV
jgi:glycosyltransferase involved in cell wall biosynthesis